ncbi:MAG: hypothetical protein V8Q27_00375 [Eubacteriales bacterium]
MLWLDEYDCTDWDGGKLIRTHRIELPIENLTEDEAAEFSRPQMRRKRKVCCRRKFSLTGRK